MRYLLALFFLLTPCCAESAPAATPPVECLKLSPTYVIGCVPAPGTADFPKDCSEHYALPAAAACTKLIETGPARLRVWAYFFRANAYGYVHYHDKAIEDFNKVLAEMPDFVPALSGRAVSYISLKKYGLAQKDIERALEIRTGYFPALTEMFYLDAALGHHDDAQADLEIAMTVEPQTADGYYARGIFVTRIFERDDKPLADYSRAIELEPDHSLALLGRSEIYARSHQMDLAMKDCDATAAFKLPPDETHLCRAMAFEMNRQYAEALPEFRAVLAVRPDKDFAWTDCASIEILTGHFAEALPDLDRAIEINPGAVGNYMNRGVAHRHLGQTDLALADYATVIKMEPKYEKAYVNRGVVYLALKDFDRAAADFEKALSLRPDDWAAQQGLDRAQHKIDAPIGMTPKVSH